MDFVVLVSVDHGVHWYVLVKDILRTELQPPLSFQAFPHDGSVPQQAVAVIPAPIASVGFVPEIGLYFEVAELQQQAHTERVVPKAVVVGNGIAKPLMLDVRKGSCFPSFAFVG